MGEGFEVDGLAAERWGEGVPVYVLLHAGVADRRSWREVAPALDGPAVAYDRRGVGDTPPAQGEYRDLDDLVAVLDAVAGDQPVWLVGNSRGGALAIDAAFAVPERVAGLVLIAPGVSGEPEPDEGKVQGAEAAILAGFEAAGDDMEELLRLEAWLWLDGPAEEGRVGGAARELALDMNRRILENAVPDEAGDSGVGAFARLEEIDRPVTVLWGALENSFQIALCETVARRVPGARREILPGTAHLPGLDAPAALAEAIVQARTSGR